MTVTDRCAEFMAEKILNRRDLEFVLFELLDAASLTARPRFADHSRETFLAACRYFFRWELPKTQPQHALLRALEPTCREMREAWF